MLEFIRERAKGWVAWVILSAVIASFALFGINQYFEGGREQPAAEVNGEKIATTSVQRAYEQQRSRLQQMLGANFDPQMFDEKRMRKDVLNLLIEEESLAQAAAAAGQRIGEAQLGTFLAQLPDLQTNGRFDTARYQQLLRSQGESSASFANKLQRDLVRQQVRQGVTDTAWIAPSEIDARYRLNEQTRDIGYFTVSASKFAADAAVNDAQLQAYYDKHHERFAVPERVSVEYIQLSAQTLADRVGVDEASLRKFYMDRATEIEQRRASHILVQVAKDADQKAVAAARAKADDVLRRIKKGEPFEDLAKQNSDDPGSARNGGDLSFFGHGVMTPPFEDAVFKMTKGQISDVVRSDFGFHIIKLTDVKVPAFEEARFTLERDYRTHKAEEIFFDLQEKLANAAFEHSDTLNNASQAVGLPVQIAPLFSRTQGAGIAMTAKVRDTAFSEELLKGMNSEPIEIGKNELVVIRVKDHPAASTRSLNEVRTEVMLLVKQEAGKAAAEAEGKKLLARAEKGETPEALAKERGVEWRRVATAKRQATAGADPAAIQAAFRLAPPQAGKPTVGGVVLPSGDYALLALYAVQPGDPSKMDAAARKALQDAALRSQSEREYRALLEDIKKAASVVTHETVSSQAP